MTNEHSTAAAILKKLGVKPTTTVKVIAHRDSATSILRKMGVKPRDYNLFIEETSDGKLAVKVGLAEKHLKDLAGPPPEELKVKAEQVAKVQELRAKLERKVKSEKAAKASKENFRAAQAVVNPVTEVPTPGETCSAYSRRMITAGHSNAELWAALVGHFGLDDRKRGYPAWYRHQMRKAGEQV